MFNSNAYSLLAASEGGNVYEHAGAGVGGWGGVCTCPDGSKYNVGDNYDSCASLACVGGMSGECHEVNDHERFGMQVTCAGSWDTQYETYVIGIPDQKHSHHSEFSDVLVVGIAVVVNKDVNRRRAEAEMRKAQAANNGSMRAEFAAPLPEFASMPLPSPTNTPSSPPL